MIKTNNFDKIRYKVLILLIFLSFLFWGNYVIGDDCNVCDKIEGIWKYDVAKSMTLRIKEGVPWHIGDKFGMGTMQAIREFENSIFLFYDEKTGELVDRGKFEVYESNDNEVTLRFFPEDNRFNLNKLKFEELIRFTTFAGDHIPYIIGLRFIDDNTVESFSYVRGFGKDKMVKKDDNAFWKKIDELPKQKNEDSSENAK